MTEAEQANYPGLNTTAAELWRDFLRVYETAFTRFDYNVRIGQGLQPPLGASAEDAALWKKLTQKRIDVVAYRRDQTWIIEIDERPGARTFGQLILYYHMADRYVELSGTKINALVCRYLGFDMFAAFKTQNTMIFKFQPGKQPSLPAAFPPPHAATKHTILGVEYGGMPSPGSEL